MQDSEAMRGAVSDTAECRAEVLPAAPGLVDDQDSDDY